MSLVETEALLDLERRVQAALRHGGVRTEALQVLGHGEISVVLGLVSNGRLLACKRMPPFPGELAAGEYFQLCERYVSLLRGLGGLAVPEQQVRWLPDPEKSGSLRVYCVQAALPAGAMVNALLGRLPAGQALRLIERVMGCIARVARYNRDHLAGPLGLDGQVSNWALTPDSAGEASPGPDLDPGAGTLWYLDTSTPMMRQEGRELLDVELHLNSLPSLLRPLVRRFFLTEILDRYYDVRQVLRDLAGNLIKERLPGLVPGAVQTANALLAGPLGFTGARPLTEREVRRYYRADARMWALMQVLRRLERFIKVRLLRRPYPFLLPEKIER